MKLNPKKTLLFLLVLITQLGYSQLRVIKGTVTDQGGMPLPGVNLIVKETKKSSQTNINGEFSIEAETNQTIIFSFIGVRTKEIKAASTTLNVKLEDDTNALNEVVVTALGIKRQKKQLGYATATVTAKDLTEVNNLNVFESLSGKLAGVDITAPSQPGSSTKVVIRGFSSFTSSEPLYIIDGTPINNSSNGSNGSDNGTTGIASYDRNYDAGNGISDLDPNNIESMTVLKGAAATALYGSRAANGAIIITTKTGKKNSALKVELTNSIDYSNVARVPHFQYDFGQGWYGQSYSGLESHGDASAENGSWGAAFDGIVRPWGAIVNNSQQIKPYTGLSNNYRDFFDYGSTYTNSIRISGGEQRSNFALSFTDVNSDGVIPTDADKYQRRSLGLNAGIESKKIDAKFNINYVNKDQNVVNTGQGDESGEGQTLIQELLQTPSDISIIDQADYTNNKFNTYSNYYTPYASNPYFLLNENSTNIKGNRFYGNINLTYKLNPKFSATYQIGGDYRVEKVKSHGAIVTYDEGSSADVNGKAGIVGGVTEKTAERKELDSYLNFNYNTKIAEDFQLSAMVGFSNNQRISDILEASITNLDLPNFYELSNTANPTSITQVNTFRKNFGVYSLLEASYKDKYFLTLTGRQDWSSTLPIENNTYFYPSASIGAIILDNGNQYIKLRAAIAKVSKDTGVYETKSSYTQAVAGAYFGTISFPLAGAGVNAYEFSSNLGNNLLKPETTIEKEFGTEITLFRKRVNIDASYYIKKTTDLLFQRDISTSTGFATQTANILDVTNRGIELVLSTTPIRFKDFRWEFNTTFTRNRSNVDKIIDGATNIELVSYRSVTYNAVLGEALGVYKSLVPKMTDSGQYIVDSNGYYVATDQQQEIGSSQRDFEMGFQNRFHYKNFTISFGFDWKQGGQMFSGTKYMSYFTGNGIETTYNDRNSFIIPNSVQEVNGVYVENTTAINSQVGTGTGGTVTAFYNSQTNPIISKEFLIDKTFVRMKDLSFTYNIKSKFAQNIGFASASVSVYGKNLMLWTPSSNAYVDPEVGNFGASTIQSEFGEIYGNPTQRSYGATIKLTF